jgi:hypothetical protein
MAELTVSAVMRAVRPIKTTVSTRSIYNTCKKKGVQFSLVANPPLTPTLSLWEREKFKIHPKND